MANATAVTDTSFKTEVLDADVPVLVDFWASWCAPCKMIAPIVEELAAEYEGRIKVVKMDIDANPMTPGSLGIMSIPTLMVFTGGKPEQRIVGYQPKAALKSKVEAVLAAS
ncbi:MAG TPA: thioredoxin [Candidatus Dormibacteraeota bacterium]|nr:thioredoxin [Candidatus Dormibacteraeota bacterium]